jgi:hypothetical protein
MAGPCRTVGREPTARRPTPAVPTPAAPTVRRDLASIGCRTDGGCRRARTACTGRRDPVRPAALRAGIMGQGLPSRTTTRTAGASRALRHRAVTLPAARDREAPARARVRRTGGRRRTAGPVRPGSPGPRGQSGQAGLRRCVSTRRLGRASRRRPDVTGPASRRSHLAR